jgi:3-hydroxyisobutyrate dehydrogenase-like beta-hydroxyacid dehydrogenase
LEDWIKQLRQFALQRLENGASVPGYKLVAKRATRQWTDEATAVAALTALGVDESELMVTELKSPAQVEKVLKKTKTAMPDGIITAISSGHTLADEADARPPVVLIGKQLTAALSKIQ